MDMHKIMVIRHAEKPDAVAGIAGVSDHGAARPLHTIKPLSQDLGIEIDKRFAVHEEVKLLDAAKSAGPVVLISWHHECIDNIAKLLGVTATG